MDQDITQITLHYDNGQTESFNLPISPQEFQQQVNLLLERPWLTFLLYDQTIFVYTNKIIKIEVKPPLQMHGVGVFQNTERVTALNRSR